MGSFQEKPGLNMRGENCKTGPRRLGEEDAKYTWIVIR